MTIADRFWKRFASRKAGTGNPFDLLTDDASWTIEGHSIASKTYPTKEAFLVEVIRPFRGRSGRHPFRCCRGRA